jgi:DNA-binding response OmpR family regulator
MRVLLIEDDPMIGQGLSKALGAEGMSVDWVRDGVDASAALAGCGHSIIPSISVFRTPKA